MGEFGAGQGSFDLGDGVDDAVFQYQALALDMAPGVVLLAEDVTAGDDGAAGGDGTGDEFGARVLGGEDGAGAEIEGRTRSRDDDAREPGDGVLPDQAGGRVHVDLPDRLHADVVREEGSILFDDSGAPREDADSGVPVMDHRGRDLRAFADVDLGHPDMRPVLLLPGTRAAGDDVDL